MTEAEPAAADPAFAITAPMHASQRPASRSLPRGACCRPCWTLSLTPSRALLPTPTSSLALLTVLEPRLNPTPELGPTLLDRAPLPVVAIAGARAYSALSCVCARWGGVTHPGTLVRAAALQFKFPIEAFSIRSTLPLPVRRNCPRLRYRSVAGKRACSAGAAGTLRRPVRGGAGRRAAKTACRKLSACAGRLPQTTRKWPPMAGG